MKKPTKRLLMSFLIAFVVGFALLNILAYNHAHAMMYFTSGGTRTEKPEKLTLGQRIKVLLTGVNVPRPVIGTVLQIIGVIFGFGNVQVGVTGLLAAIMDTGGQPWFVIFTWKDKSLWDR